MANYEREIALIGKVRSTTSRLVELLDDIASLKERYDALGGSTFLDSFYAAMPDQPVPQSEIDDAISSLNTLGTVGVSPAHKTKCYRPERSEVFRPLHRPARHHPRRRRAANATHCGGRSECHTA